MSCNNDTPKCRESISLITNFPCWNKFHTECVHLYVQLKFVADHWTLIHMSKNRNFENMNVHYKWKFCIDVAMCVSLFLIMLILLVELTSNVQFPLAKIKFYYSLHGLSTICQVSGRHLADRFLRVIEILQL